MENYQNQNDSMNNPNPYNNGNGNFMVTKLPNSTTVIILGIFSILTCCCWGIIGLILGIIGLVMAKKDTALYNSNPNQYTGIQNINTGRILCIIGIILSAIYFVYIVYLLATFGYSGMMEMNQNYLEQLKAMQNQ